MIRLQNGTLTNCHRIFIDNQIRLLEQELIAFNAQAATIRQFRKGLDRSDNTFKHATEYRMERKKNRKFLKKKS